MPTRIDNGTLVAGTVYQNIFTKFMDSVKIKNLHATGRIYARTDGVDPAVGADECYAIAPGETITVPNDKARPVQGGAAVTTDIRLISSVACDFSITEAS